MSDNMTTAVSLKVLEIKPAVVNFNYQEISDHLDSVLEKYRGLVFTESTVADCKKTIAELRKGQKSLDEFRKSTKNQLTESVTAFENQCKTLHGKFDEVIQPLTKQQDQFELERKEKKRAEVKTIIDALISEHNLTAKYADQLIIQEDYLNKGKTIKSIKTELSGIAKTMKVQQDKEVQDIDLIKTKVELANAQYQISNALMPDNYLRLLTYKTVAEIEALIASDAEQVSAREVSAREAAELATKAETEAAPVTLEVTKAEIVEAPKVETIKVPNAVEFTSPVGLANTTGPVMAKAVSSMEMITAVYEITGTEEQLSALEAYLDASGLSWLDRPNG